MCACAALRVFQATKWREYVEDKRDAERDAEKGGAKITIPLPTRSPLLQNLTPSM